jgi:DNA-binding LacI/PurR family transcriptional regulator
VSTIRKVAKDAGVSIATVSRVINSHASVTDDVRSRVLEAVNRCGYVPSVGKRAANFVALTYVGRLWLGTPYEAALVEGMASAMDVNNDLDLVILNLKRDMRPAEPFTQFFLRKGVRGVIIRATARDRDVCRAIARERFPAIVLGDHFEDPLVSCVYSDSRPTSYQGMEHLIALGHQRIAFASCEREDGDHADRFNAYRDALANHDLRFDPRLVFRIPPSRPDGAQLLRNVMSSMSPPTALFVADPLVAVGAINEAHNLRVRIPQDLSILGFDDTDVRNNVFPKMTAICQDTQQNGYEAFVSLAQMIGQGIDPERVLRVAPTWLEINSTTSAPTPEPFRILPDGTRLEVA